MIILLFNESSFRDQSVAGSEGCNSEDIPDNSISSSEKPDEKLSVDSSNNNKRSRSEDSSSENDNPKRIKTDDN